MKKSAQIEHMISVVMLIVAILCSSCTNMQKKKSETYLRTAMQELRSDLPSTIDEVTTLVEVSMEGSNFVYTYYVNDYADGMLLLQAWDINDTKNGILQNARLSLYDDDYSEFIKAVKQAGYNLVYRYISQYSGYSLDIVVYPSEL